MTSQLVGVEPNIQHSSRGGMFLGFGTAFRKELTEWLRGPKALIIAAVSIAGAVFMTLIPYIARATGESEAAGMYTMDPTTNVLLGWTGLTVPLIAIVATMALVSAERDRGTLAWSLSHPVSPSSIIGAKFSAALLVFSVVAVVLPLLAAVGVATLVYGGLPDLSTVARFGLLYLTVPAFYVALTVGLGTGLKSTVGVAGVALAVMLVPQIVGGLVPVLGELSPTSIGTWALAAAKGQPASALTPLSWVIAMTCIVVGAKLVFDRQEP